MGCDPSKPLECDPSRPMGCDLFTPMGCDVSGPIDCDTSRPKPQAGSARAPKRHSWLPQLSLLHEYSIGEMLGQGACSVVSTCKRRSTGEGFAVKMIDKAENSVVDIGQEVDMLCSLEHLNIVKFHGVYEGTHFISIVMDKYGGGDLVTGLQTHLKEHGQIPCHKVIHVSRQICESIAYLHSRNVIHRDIKGDNYLMDRKDITSPECKIALADFGTACFIEAGERLRAQVGTKIFWAPEIFDKNYGAKVDVWAMGVILYGLVSGCFPFKDRNGIKTKEVCIRDRVDPFCADFIKKLLDKNEVSRPESCAVIKHKWLASAHTKELDTLIIKNFFLSSAL